MVNKYSSSSIPFVIAEAGTHARDADIQARLAWLEVLSSNQVQQALPNLESITWYNALRKTDVLSNGVGGDTRSMENTGLHELLNSLPGGSGLLDGLSNNTPLGRAYCDPRSMGGVVLQGNGNGNGSQCTSARDTVGHAIQQTSHGVSKPPLMNGSVGNFGSLIEQYPFDDFETVTFTNTTATVAGKKVVGNTGSDIYAIKKDQKVRTECSAPTSANVTCKFLG